LLYICLQRVFMPRRVYKLVFMEGGVLLHSPPYRALLHPRVDVNLDIKGLQGAVFQVSATEMQTITVAYGEPNEWENNFHLSPEAAEEAAAAAAAADVALQAFVAQFEQHSNA